MKNVFSNRDLQVYASMQGTNLILGINSDFLYSEHKSKLYFSKQETEELAKDFENFWATSKKLCPKLTAISLGFDPIDHYDSAYSSFETPYFSIGKGLRKAKVGSHEHGDIPKDWGVDVRMTFTDIKQKAGVIAVLKNALGNKYSQEIEKKFEKLNELISGKVKSINY